VELGEHMHNVGINQISSKFVKKECSENWEVKLLKIQLKSKDNFPGFEEEPRKSL
jgi:hypothetical protein